LRAHDRGERVPDLEREVDPVGPRGDEPTAPLLDARGQPPGRLTRQPAERVAVDVDPVAVVEDEPAAKGSERIGPVERLGIVAGQGSQSITARQAADDGSRCS
jgi:hypothetical protein